MPTRTVKVVLAEPTNKKDAGKTIHLSVAAPLKTSGTAHVSYREVSGKRRAADGSYEATTGSTTFKFKADGNAISIQCYGFNGELEKGTGVYESPHHLHMVKWTLGSKDFG